MKTPGYALIVLHKARPGMRDEVHRVWRKHLQPAIAADAGHPAYFFCFGLDPDSIYAFQQYRDHDAAPSFLRTPQYAHYLAEVTPLLLDEPIVTLLDVKWSKGVTDDD